MNILQSNSLSSVASNYEELLVKIVCVGGFTGGVGTKGVFIDDYLEVWPPVQTYRSPLIGVKFYLKTIRKQHRETDFYQVSFLNCEYAAVKLSVQCSFEL